MAETDNTSSASIQTVASSNEMITSLSKKREALIYASYEDPTKKESAESNNSVIDIISNYAWNNETAKSTASLSYTTNSNIPCCFAIEREQTVASSIMNIVRDAEIVAQGWDMITNQTSEVMSKLFGNKDDDKNTGGIKIDAKQINETKNLSKKLNSNILKKSKVDGASVENSVLSPYNFLYSTQMTGFKYAFPMLNAQDLYSLNSEWVSGLDQNTGILLKNSIFNMLHEIAGASANTIASDLPNIKAVIDGLKENANRSSVFEMARYFNFSMSDCDEVKINFVLFNTVVKNGEIDQWKRNFYFISLFNMRNLPFKLDYTTYLPPLLYDVIIPGVKRLPFCYVSSFNTTPYGLIRNMKINNFLGAIGGADKSSNTIVSVPIPEAWGIEITFKSMLARSANIMLGGGADLPISINQQANYSDAYQKEYNDAIDKQEKNNVVYNFIAQQAAEKAAKPITDLLYGKTRKEEEKEENYKLTGLTSAEGDNVALNYDSKWRVQNDQTPTERLTGLIGRNTIQNEVLFPRQSNNNNIPQPDAASKPADASTLYANERRNRSNIGRCALK